MSPSSRPPRAVRATLALLAVGLLASACGKSSGNAPKATTTTAASANPDASTWAPSPVGKLGTEPTVVVPKAAPPTHLVSEDLITGTGKKAKTGDTVSVQYVGVDYSNGKVFDASWLRHQAYSFPLGAHQVIAGWDQGVVGMRVGGRRELIIPPSLAYGASPPPGAPFGPNATLIFIVDLVKIG